MKNKGDSKKFRKKKKTERVNKHKEKKHGENNSENASRKKKEIRIVTKRRADMKRGHKTENKLRRKSKENEIFFWGEILNRNKGIKRNKMFFKKGVDNKEKLSQCFWRSCMRKQTYKKNWSQKEEKQKVFFFKKGQESKIFL